jgi:hypothetical protein
VPLVIRNAIKDTTLPVGGGEDGQSPIFIAKGNTILLNVYAMHRNEDLFGKDADQFRPDRWETLRPGAWVRTTVVCSNM